MSFQGHPPQHHTRSTRLQNRVSLACQIALLAMTSSSQVEMKISVLRSEGGVGDEQNAFSMASPRLFTSAASGAGGAGGRFAEVGWEG